MVVRFQFQIFYSIAQSEPIPSRSPCFVRNSKTKKSNNILRSLQASTWYRSAFPKFSWHGKVCKLRNLSTNFLVPQLVRSLGSDKRSQRSNQAIPIRDQIMLMTLEIVWNKNGELERQATWAGTATQRRTPPDFTHHFFKMNYNGW